MTKNEKQKKSLIRRILKWTGISFLVLLVILIIVPIIFKDKIKELVIEEANKTLTAKLELGEFDLTFLSTFPNMSIKLYDTKITGKGEFKGVELVNIKEFTANVGFWDVVGGDKISIKAIHLEEPKFDVRILNNGKANYDITIPDSVKTPDQQEPSSFHLALENYSITNAQIKYDDQVGDMYAELKNLTHTGKGDLTADVIDFETTTTIDELTYEMEGVSYLKKVKTEAIANILMEFTEKTSKFTLKENTFALNALHFSLDGFYEMLEKKDNMDLKINAAKATFKDFLSLIPTFYQSGYESMIADGNLAFNAEVKGIMDDVNMPGWDFNLSVDKAKIKYPDLPGSINNITVKAGSKFIGGADLDKMTLDVPKFHAEFVGNTIDANLALRNPMTDPLINSKIIAKVNLATLGKVVPMAEGESYNGKLNADVLLNGRMSAIENENYEAFKATGTLLVSDMLYKSKDLPTSVAIKEMLLRFTPQNLSLESLNATMGKSDFQMAGKIDNYLGYALKNELLKGAFTFTSSNLDLDELMGSTTSTATPTTTASSETTTTTEASEPFLIPNNIDFNLTTAIANVKYNGINIKNISGGVKMKEEVATLDNLKMNTMGGTVILKGNYNTKEHTKPIVDFGYDLIDIDIQQLATNFITIEKLAPISKYSKGKISSKFDMKSALNSKMEPVYNTLDGAGNLLSKSIEISGFKPLEKIGESLKINKLAKQTIKDLNAYFQFANGKVTVKPFNVKLGNISSTVSGSTSFEQDIDYKLKMNIPKEDIPSSMVKVAEDQLKKLNGAVPNLKLAELPSVIPVDVLIGGKVTDPKVTTNFKEALLAATGNAKDLGKQLVNQAKDSVKTVVKNKIKEVKEDLTAKKQQILDDAQKQADKLVAEAKKAANAIRNEADQTSAQAIAEAGANPIKKKAAELIAKKAKEVQYKKADQLEQEAQQKADQIMTVARTKADQIK